MTVCKPLIQSHELNERLSFEQRAPGLDELGNPNGAWQLVFVRWAKAEPLRGREFFAAQQMQQVIDVRFTVRWCEDITPQMRCVWRGQPYELLGPPIDVKARREALELMCAAGVRDGR